MENKMDNKRERLFSDFPPVSTEQWMEAITKDLKGADFNKKLVWKTPDGFDVRPFYRAEDLEHIGYLDAGPGQFPYVRGHKTKDNNWEIRQDFHLEDAAACNALAAQAAAKGYFSPEGNRPVIYVGQRKLTFTQQDFQAIEQVRQMILKNPEANLTIAQLGHKVFLNEQKLKTGFHLCYHTTIGAFIKDCRMARASELLVHTSATIEEIARTCGYGSSTGFIRAFRQKYQITPLRFRQEK